MSRSSRLSGWTREPGRRPLVLGHRGVRPELPENTLAAFERALALGADGVELDVRLDRDGRVIVLHDPTLGRVSGGSETRAAEDLRASELDRVDLGHGERVPLLADVLVFFRERAARVNVELKRDVRRPLALLEGVKRAVIASGAPPELVLLSSFQPAFVAALACLVPRFPRAWLVHGEQRLLRRAPLSRLLGADGVNPHHALVTEAAIARWKRRSLLISTWTVNGADEAKRVAALGVDAIISDQPGVVLGALGSD